MPSSLLQSAWIFFRCTIAMIKIVTQVAFYGAIHQLSRTRVNNLVRAWAHKMLSILQVNCTVFNPHQVDLGDHKRYLYMVNHASLFDIPICYASLPGEFRMIAKKELFKIPFFGYAMRKAEVPSIDRFNKTQAIQDLRIVRERMESGLAIWMAPEGTRSRDGRLQPLKKGGFILAIQADAIIVPVGIRGAHLILPKKTWHFQPHQDIEVHIGKPINASEYTLENKNALIERVTAEMKSLMGQDD